MDHEPSTAARAVNGEPQPRTDAARRTYLLAATLTASALVGATRLDLDVEPTTSFAVPIWGIAAVAVLGALMVFDVEFRRETYTFTFSEMVLVLGLFFATPLALVGGRLLGEMTYLTVRERQARRKLVLNMSVVLAETIVLLTVQQALVDRMDVRSTGSWLVALTAVVAAELVGFAAVAAAVRWHGGPITFRAIARIGLMTAPANTGLTVVVCVLLEVEPAAVPLLGGIVGFLLVTYRAYSSLRQRHESLSLLYDFTHLVSGAREPNEVLDAMLNQAKDLLRAERAELWLRTGDATYERHVVADGVHTADWVPLPVALAAVVDDQLVERRDAVVLRRDTSDAAERGRLAALDARDALIAPLTEGTKLVGYVVVANRLSEIYTFVEQDARLFGTLASHAGVALQNGRLIKRLHEQARQREHEALHDSLTGLPNRVRFAAHLAARFAEETPVAIALMDLDGFKEVNDTLGHQSGDQVLVEVARRLRQAVDDSMLVARLGGDEFALVADPGTSRHQLDSTCRAIRTAVEQPIEIDGIRITMGVSVGLAFAPADGEDAETLIRRADVAMYAAKSGRNGGVCAYDADRDHHTPRRLALAHDLRQAVERGELRPVFQPKIELATGRVSGVEALCRWKHPTLGDVLPSEFIALADRTGISSALTELMLSVGLEEAERWERAGHDLTLAVNVSMHALLDADLAEVVRRLLSSTTVRPEQVILEITETSVMTDADRTMHALDALSRLGVGLSIDDFGTGYSSLAYLQRLPVVEVKIDRSFVASMSVQRGADAIVRSVIDLARNLDLRVVAEGVEDSTAAERLRDLGCHEAQGFFYAPPLPADEVARLATVRNGAGAPTVVS